MVIIKILHLFVNICLRMLLTISENILDEHICQIKLIQYFRAWKNFKTHSLYWIYLSLIVKKFLADINILKSVPGTNQYWAISLKFLAQGNNALSLTGSEPIRLVILRLLVWCVNHLTTPPLLIGPLLLSKR